MLNHLLHMSTDGTPEGRSRLLFSVTDLFLLERNPSGTARDHYAQIAAHSLSQMETPDRASYAERVAAEPTLPPSVAKTLASDEDIAVARLVLKLSPVLTDEDLASIALSHSQEHLIAIAERAAISEITTEVLMTRGSDTVLRLLNGHGAARFSARGVSRMMERSDVSPDVARDLAEKVAQPQERQAQRVLRIAIETEQSTGSASRHARARQQEVMSLIEDVREGRQSRDDVIKLLADEDRAFDLAVFIGTFAGIAPAQMLKALLEADVSAVAIACRSIDLPNDVFRSVLLLRAQRLRQSTAQAERDLADYADLPENVSEQTIELLKARSPAHA